MTYERVDLTVKFLWVLVIEFSTLCRKRFWSKEDLQMQSAPHPLHLLFVVYRPCVCLENWDRQVVIKAGFSLTRKN